MVTSLYLHRTAKSLGSGTLPTTEQSTLTQAGLLDALANNKHMDTVRSVVAQTSFSAAIAMTATSKNVYIGRWVSDFLGVTSIAANTWLLNYAANSNSGLCYFPGDGNAKVYANIYIWRPSTNSKVGTVVDGASATNTVNELETTETCVYQSFTGSAVTCQIDDVIIVEVWTKPKSLGSETPTLFFYYDGATSTTLDGASVSNHASFLRTPQDNLFSVPAVDCTVTGKAIATKQIVHG